MSNLELSADQWVGMYCHFAVILAEEYGDGSLETIIDEDGNEDYTEDSQERFDNYADEAESIMLRLGLRCPEIFSPHESEVNHAEV